MEERNYKLYVHISPSNKRYYGITSMEPENRWKNGKGYTPNKHFTNAINKYGWDNFEHIVLFDNLTKGEASLLEQCYIALYDTTNGKYGYNIDLGGNVPSIETREKISKANTGKHHTEETKKKMSKVRKGKKLSEQCKHKISERNKKMWADPNSGFNSEERRRKLSESMQGKKMSEEAKKKMSERQKGENNNHAKVILMYTLDGVFIKKFNCIADANEYLGKKRTYSSIGECLKGKTKSCNGYMWKYMDDEINYNIQPYNNEYQYIGKNHPQSKPILMYDLQGNFIKRFNCNREASEYLGKEGINTSISACASGKTRSAYGYIWIYQTNDNYPKKLSKKYVDEVKNLKKGKNHPQAKAVLMFTLHGEFIRRFDCIKDANEYLGKPRNSVNINMNASGKSKSAFGYKWIYEENYIKEQKEAI